MNSFLLRKPGAQRSSAGSARPGLPWVTGWLQAAKAARGWGERQPSGHPCGHDRAGRPNQPAPPSSRRGGRLREEIKAGILFFFPPSSFSSNRCEFPRISAFRTSAWTPAPLAPRHYRAKNGRESEKHFVPASRISSRLAEPRAAPRRFTPRAGIRAGGKRRLGASLASSQNSTRDSRRLGCTKLRLPAPTSR